MLETQDVVRHLLNLGLIQVADVVLSDIEVHVVERKNISFRVSTANTSLLLKRPRMEGESSLQNEAQTYANFSRNPVETSLKYYLPEFVGYDPIGSLLILKFLDGAENLRAFHLSTKRAPSRIGNELGIALGVLHDAANLDLGIPSTNGSLPWVLQLMAPPLDILSTESLALIELIRWIQENPVLRELIVELQSAWTIDALCHNDLRLENLLYTTRLKSVRSSHTHIVDWELCEPNWSYWDVASVFASYVELWAITASSVSNAAKIRAFSSPAYAKMTHFQPILRSFWSSYRARRVLPAATYATAETIVKLIAARLLQSALEYSQQSMHITKESVVLFQLAVTILKRPVENWVHILGLPLATPAGRILMHGIKPISYAVAADH